MGGLYVEPVGGAELAHTITVEEEDLVLISVESLPALWVVGGMLCGIYCVAGIRIDLHRIYR